MQHDIIIIGSGLGGLLTAVLLAKEGYNVGIVEQNKQIGGCLQTFSFDKKVFDSAVHYIGSLGEGEVQHKIWSYVGIQNQLQLQQLDIDCFDKVYIGDAEVNFSLAQGLERFSESLKIQFPVETQAVNRYVEKLQFTCSKFPLYNLRNGDASEKNAVMHWKLSEVLKEIDAGQTLQNLLCGNAILYAGNEATTPFYQHALVSKSYIDSAWKCIGGSSQISKLLWKKLQEYGGVIYKNEKIISLESKEGSIVKALSSNGNEFVCKHFIANIHPQQAIALLADKSLLKPVFRNRVSALRNTIGSIMINLVLRPETVKYRNYNINWNKADSLKSVSMCKENFPSNYSIYFTEDKAHKGFAESVSILAYIDTQAFSTWKNTFNATVHPDKRAEDYEAFKQEKAHQILELLKLRFPEITANIQSMKVATPLTYRDYQGSVEGSLYGIEKDVNQLSQSSFTTKTKIPNLFLTGQNINLHGVLGVSMTAINSAADFVGLDYLLQKINKI